MVQFELLERVFLEEVAIANFPALAFDFLGGGAVSDDEQNVGLFGGEIAHEVEQEIVFADGQILHTVDVAVGISAAL
jgi:hypothetical protein